MNEDQLRALVREVVARHVGGSESPASATGATGHASHFLVSGLPDPREGPCVIEPAVRCHHCRYCQSLGH
jgi:hypothetical protein